MTTVKMSTMAVAWISEVCVFIILKHLYQVSTTLELQSPIYYQVNYISHRRLAMFLVLDILATLSPEITIPSDNKGRFGYNSKVVTPISERLPVENKAKLSQLTRADFVTIEKLTHQFQSDCL